ncbi:MAG: hypothetical protein ACLT3I_00040 [Ruminococcus sp.]|nr:hypothetical protein [Ruminococcus sp.]
MKPLFPYRERRFSVEQVRSTNKKFFGAAVFQKCWQGVGEQPIFAKQIKLHNERKQKSKRESQRIATSQVQAMDFRIFSGIALIFSHENAIIVNYT